MERRGVVVGVLAVVAVALAAGAVSSPSASSVADGTGSVGGSGAVGFALGGVLWLVALVALLVGGVGLAVARLREGGDGGGRLRGRFVALVFGVVAVVVGVLLTAVRVFGDGEGPRRQEGVGAPLVQGSPEASTATGGPGPGVVLAVLVVLVLAAVAVVAYRRVRGGDDEAEPESANESGAASASSADGAVDGVALGSAAGRAASSLDGSGSPPENEVVRAWRELASVLPVSRPASSTPREFAAAATAAGVDADDVAELAALFEAVRYGDRDAGGERARRAVAALERIEAAHGDASGDGAARGDTAGAEGAAEEPAGESS